MTVHLSKEVENFINAAVQSGQFASADEMVSKLVQEYSERLQQQPANADHEDATPDPLMGIWRDCADEMDEIVADAMKRRKQEPFPRQLFFKISPSLGSSDAEAINQTR